MGRVAYASPSKFDAPLMKSQLEKWRAFILSCVAFIIIGFAMLANCGIRLQVYSPFSGLVVLLVTLVTLGTIAVISSFQAFAERKRIYFIPLLASLVAAVRVLDCYS